MDLVRPKAVPSLHPHTALGLPALPALGAFLSRYHFVGLSCFWEKTCGNQSPAATPTLGRARVLEPSAHPESEAISPPTLI